MTKCVFDPCSCLEDASQSYSWSYECKFVITCPHSHTLSYSWPFTYFHWAYLIWLSFLMFRVSSNCRSKRCQTQTASLPTRNPGQYSKFPTVGTVVDQLFRFSCNTAVGQMGRLDETHSPTKKLPPESTPQVMFTGFEPTQVQQYTKVIFNSISNKTDVYRCLISPWLRLHVVCMFLYHSGFMLWEVK